MGSANESLATEDVTLLSHAHGRERRNERSIEKIELQACIKHGKKEPACPGRDGSSRWRFTHNDVVCIMDETCRHEVTSWRLAHREQEQELDGPEELGEIRDFSFHIIFVVDSSGSMRRNDVSGFATRTEAVYNSIQKQFLEEQLLVSKACSNAVVTLIEMGQSPQVIFEHAPLTADMMKVLKKRASSRAQGHGHYIPSLDKVRKILTKEADNQGVQFMIIFLSDGAPSDHVDQLCGHGYSVWENDPDEIGQLIICPYGKGRCRQNLKMKVQQDCCAYVSRLIDCIGIALVGGKDDRICCH